MHVIVACAESDGNNCFHLLLLMGNLFQLFFFAPTLPRLTFSFPFRVGETNVKYYSRFTKCLIQRRS